MKEDAQEKRASIPTVVWWVYMWVRYLLGGSPGGLEWWYFGRLVELRRMLGYK